MAPALAVPSGYTRQPVVAGKRWLPVLALALLGALCACSATAVKTRVISDLTPLQWEGRTLTVAEVARRVPSPDFLATDAEMREFVKRYTGHGGNARQRLISLHRAVTGAGILNIEYDPFADGTARETFHRGSANCLAYANLFVALAREAGLDAGYQWLDVRPEWNRIGERVVVGLHVNVSVKLRSGQEYMVDIDPLPARKMAGSMKLKDSDARALYHSNIAMDALARADLEQAWLRAVRALQLSPRMAHLWVNLGAVYRTAGQHHEAERSYLYALELDSSAHSAMTNLAILYGIDGLEQEREYWLERIGTYRRSNPYYHAWLGDRAVDQGDWREALKEYDSALDLTPHDSRMLFTRGQIHYQLGELDDAALDIERAIKNATLGSEIQNYQQTLDEVRREQLAEI